MKALSIGIVVILLAIAFYATDRIKAERRSFHLADSLDSINSSITKGSIDSLAKATNLNYNARINQLSKRIRYQDGTIIRLKDRLDSLIAAQRNGR